VQDWSDVHSHRRVGPPVGDQLHPVTLARVELVGEVQPGEGVQTQIDPDGEPLGFVGGDEGVDGGGEVSPPLPVGEQIHVLAGAGQDAVGGDGVPAGEGEPVGSADAQSDARQPLVYRDSGVGRHAAMSQAGVS